MIECIDVSLKYEDGKNEKIVLDNVNLQIRDKDNVVLLGPSGSGKSSLIYVLAGLIKPTSGKILYDGLNSKKFSKKQFSNLRREKFGYIFQQHFLIPYLTIEENVLAGAPSLDNKYREKVRYILSELGLCGYEDRKIYELSGGERQRVAIARALVSDPDIIFADEPTASLDHDTAVEIYGILKKLRNTTTLIMATHDMSILDGTESIIRIDHANVTVHYPPDASSEELAEFWFGDNKKS